MDHLLVIKNRIKGVIAGKPTKFAVMFTLGNVVSLLGTMFLSGPAK